ncbi:MAG: hypothetical protein ACFBSE_16695, partial [Prochloraceae cyanobacterium]
FANLNCQKINAKQFTIQGKLFNIGTSYRNRRSALRAIEDYLQVKIFAFLVEDKSKSFVTIMYSIPSSFESSKSPETPTSPQGETQKKIESKNNLSSLQYRGRRY